MIKTIRWNTTAGIEHHVHALEEHIGLEKVRQSPQQFEFSIKNSTGISVFSEQQHIHQMQCLGGKEG
jgi:hypothetical protein